MMGLLVAAIAAFLIYQLTGEKTPTTDKATFCPIDARHIPHVEVVVFERNRRSDAETGKFRPLSPNTIMQIRRHLEQRLVGLPKYTMVAVYEANYQEANLYNPVDRFCSPGDGSNLTGWTGNPALAKERYEKKFKSRFAQLTGNLSQWKPGYSYSLMTALRAVDRLELSNPELDHATKALTVVSDFLVPENFGHENWKKVTMSTPLADFEATAHSRKLRFDFSGAIVHMLYIDVRYVNIPNVQGPAHQDWWRQFFESQNAILEEITAVGQI